MLLQGNCGECRVFGMHMTQTTVMKTVSVQLVPSAAVHMLFKKAGKAQLLTMLIRVNI